MNYQDENNNFLSFEGRIGRKNYVINLLILCALFLGLWLIRFDSLYEIISLKFLYTVLIFMVGLLKFAIGISILSVIYRRLADLSGYDEKFRKLFFFLYLFPVLYILYGHYVLDFLPALLLILDYLTIFLLILAVIYSIIIAFIKSKN